MRVIQFQPNGDKSLDLMEQIDMKSFYARRCFYATLVSSLLLIGCSPEVGSEKWCAQLEATPKGDWSANMAADYAKHCIFKMKEESE